VLASGERAPGNQALHIHDEAAVGPAVVHDA
jgi:hypothetical protein